VRDRLGLLDVLRSGLGSFLLLTTCTHSICGRLTTIMYLYVLLVVPNIRSGEHMYSVVYGNTYRIPSNMRLAGAFRRTASGQKYAETQD
jgi:hypothetical protein